MRKIKWSWKKWGVCLGGLLILGCGFMGIEKFNPEERSLVIANKPETVSSSVAVDKITAENETVKTTGEAEEAALKIKAKSAVLIDGAGGSVLYEKNPYEHLPPASVTKVMTLLLILEGVESGKIALDDKVAISSRAAGMGGSQMYMEPGEKHTVEELLKGVIMVSANDGCVAYKKQGVWENN